VGGAADCGRTARRVGIGGCRRAGWWLNALHLDDPKSWRQTPAPALAAGGVLAALVALPHQGGATEIDGGVSRRCTAALDYAKEASVKSSSSVGESGMAGMVGEGGVRRV